MDPSAFVPPDDGLPIKNGCRWDEDPYEKIVRGNLQMIDKQKVNIPMQLSDAKSDKTNVRK